MLVSLRTRSFCMRERGYRYKTYEVKQGPCGPESDLEVV